MTRLVVSLFALVFLAACGDSDSTNPATAPDDEALAPGEFRATFRAPDSEPVPFEGSVAADLSASETSFRGVFHDLDERIAPNGRTVYFSLLTLQDHRGAELRLGRARTESRPVTGGFGIEAGRDLESPYGFFASYLEPDEVEGRATRYGVDGAVFLDVSEKAVEGSFDIEFSDGSVLRGTFVAGRS
ncbi:MAG TPA: hypothetical protein VKA86_04020 [Candidatus Krumholzibacteria bacterium]|nr:hypothetical protein [Candidatus Krumholzibacteria bacterium]